MIETERLYMIPLNLVQLTQYIHSPIPLQQELGVQSFQERLTVELLDTLEQVMLPRVASKGNDWRYVTLWLIIEKHQRLVIGDLFFKGEPDEKGRIEIGYGMDEPYRQKGFMTEALTGIKYWVSNQPAVKMIIAETNSGNTASIKTLTNSGFRLYKKERDNYWYQFVFGTASK